VTDAANAALPQPSDAALKFVSIPPIVAKWQSGGVLPDGAVAMSRRTSSGLRTVGSQQRVFGVGEFFFELTALEGADVVLPTFSPRSVSAKDARSTSTPDEVTSLQSVIASGANARSG
jgi:hypothetical protein